MTIGSLALVAVALAFVAGCGEDTERKNEYVKRLNEVQRSYGERIGRSLASVQADFVSTRRALADAARVSEEAAADLDAIEPPDEIEREHDSLVSSLEDFAGRLRGLREAVRGKDIDTVQRSLSEFTEGSRNVSRDIGNTIGTINRKLQDG